MYPRTYFETFMRYEATDQVFVAMPFSVPFRRAFESVIEPAIKRVSVNGRQLNPRIINRATSGAPDIHEQIFDAVLHSRLVIADMTVQFSCAGDTGTQMWQPNANVAYEVGLASAWRNPEDILLIHQGHPNHSYGFDVQNLRHVQYDSEGDSSVALLTDEIVRALNQSVFLARMAFQRILESASPTVVQFMHLEARRAFPVVAFPDEGMPIMDARIHAATEPLAGALGESLSCRKALERGRHHLRVDGAWPSDVAVFECDQCGAFPRTKTADRYRANWNNSAAGAKRTS
ncbi:MAG: hypothetical protein U0470_10265 [Anaerolineae bacterium]